MNILEDQVTDLNYLAESPIAISGIMNGDRQSSATSMSAEGNPGGPNENGTKRKSSDINGETNQNGSAAVTHTRAKRNRYISIAWYVCN